MLGQAASTCRRQHEIQMLQVWQTCQHVAAVCAGIRADMYQDRSRWHWPKCRLLPEYTKPATVLAARCRNCRVSQKLSDLSLAGSACVTVSPAGIPPWLRPRQWSNLWVFFPAVFGSITESKPHVLHRPFRIVAFGTGTAESQPSHAASNFFNGRKACGAQTELTFTLIQLTLIFTGGLLLKHLRVTSPRLYALKGNAVTTFKASLTTL